MSNQEQILERIAFLEKQLDSLDHYLPDTYQFLMAELDCQQRELMELRLQDFYWNQSNEQQDPNNGSRDQTQGQESDYRIQSVQQ